MDNNWRINQQNSDGSTSDRFSRRKFEREFKKFEFRIKDRFWWRSLEIHEKKRVYDKMVYHKMKESEIKLEIPGNIIIRRDLILERLIEE